MQISFNNPIITPKSEIIKDSKKILHIIASEFPAISGTKISEFDSAKDNPFFQNFAKTINNRIKTQIRDPIWKQYMLNPDSIYIELVNRIKKYRVANCADYSKLWNLIANLNGIKTSSAQIYLINKKGILVDHIDHAINIINLNENNPIKMNKFTKLKDILIVDPWLGFLDYANNADKKFKYDYGKFFKIPQDYQLFLNPHVNQNPPVTPNAIEYFKNKFPQLFLTGKK